MGSITKPFKTPKITQPRTVFVPAPAPLAPVLENTSSEPSEEEKRSETRRKNLLRRNRGKLGTVLTGFRGVLGRVNTSGGQKTLLGE